MIVVILAGGLGTRLSEETFLRPKPLVLLNDQPILWHIMNIFASQISCEIKIATGYKNLMIDDYLNSQFPNKKSINAESIFTGETSQTGTRIKQVMKAFPGSQILVTYGDGVADIALKKLIEFHNSHGKLATVTAVRPPARFGRLQLLGDKVVEFSEKSQSMEGWINGGFFVFQPEVIKYLSDDDSPLEFEPLTRLSLDSQLMAFKHFGFWQPMDTLREKHDLEKLIRDDKAPWMHTFDNNH
jgi:glucose-1-phosphate cytidylyltransferase